MATLFSVLLGVCFCTTTWAAAGGLNPGTTISDAAIYQYASQSLKAVEELNSLTQHGITMRTVKVCYDFVGCFWSNGTFKYIWSVPASPEEIDTQLLLYTRRNPFGEQKLDYRDITTLKRSNLRKGKGVKIICHGFGGSSELWWVQSMKSAFLEKEDVHVIVVDWRKGAAVPNYLAAVPNTELVGRQVAVLLNQIRLTFGIGWDMMHMVGFSMGAQVAGFVGKSTQSMFHGKMARITALDAAAPLFEGYGPDVHIDASDAQFVDSIHTNADSTFKAGCGMKDPIGHVDFYPNGGVLQPGCNHYTITGFMKDMFTGNKERECHHMRAVRLFIESMRNKDCSFLSFPCTDYGQYEQNRCFMCVNGECGEMGYYAKGLGTYYTVTNDKVPYCSLPLMLTAVSSETQEKTFGQLEIALYAENGYKEIHNLTDERGNLLPKGISISRVSSSPKMASLQQVTMTYRPFNGYFRKGSPQWKVNNVVVMKPNGLLFVSCNVEVELEASVPKVITATEGCL